MRIILAATLMMACGCGVPDLDQVAEETASQTDVDTSTPGGDSDLATTDDSNAGPDSEIVKATAGVGKQGQSLKGEGGVFVTPIRAYFNTQQRLTFDVQLKQAFDLYKASNGAPKSQDEYMQRVVRANQIRLPELPAGHEYVYDVEQETLMVKRPK